MRQRSGVSSTPPGQQQQAPSQEAGGDQDLDLAHTLLGVSDVLLTSFAAAVAATREPVAHAGLMELYREARERCCDELLDAAVDEMRRAEAAAAASGGQAALGLELLIW